MPSCENCGSKVSDNAKFCSNCGEELNYPTLLSERKEATSKIQWNLEQFLLDNTPNEKGIITCPRCLGKGNVDNTDIQRLSMEHHWMPGWCRYCDGIGSVNVNKISAVSITDLISESSLSEPFGNQNLDETYSSEDVLSSWFNLSHLKTYKRYHYLEKIPQKKLKEFCSSYTDEFVANTNFYVFYDDSLFGTGGNGFAIAKGKDEKWFLLVNSSHGKYLIYFEEGAIRFPLGNKDGYAPTDAELRQAQLITIRNWVFSKLTPYLRKRDWELFIGFLIYNGHFDPFSYLANVKMWRPEMADEIISRLNLNCDTDSKLKDSAGIR